MATKTKAKPKAGKKPHAGRNGAVKPAAAPSDVLSLDEAAAYLRVAVTPLREDATAGRLPGRVVGGQWRFSKAALQGWLAGTATAAEIETERLRVIRDSPPTDETEEEYQEFMASIEAFRDEVNRATRSGKYAAK